MMLQPIFGVVGIHNALTNFFKKPMTNQTGLILNFTDPGWQHQLKTWLIKSRLYC